MFCLLFWNTVGFVYFFCGALIGHGRIYRADVTYMYIRIAQCILPALRTRGWPYFKTYHLTWTSRTTPGACIAGGKCVSLSYIYTRWTIKIFHARPRKHDRSLKVVFKSKVFTVVRNYAIRYSAPSTCETLITCEWFFRKMRFTSQPDNLLFFVNNIILFS